MFVFIGDPEQPTGSASSHFAQLVIQKVEPPDFVEVTHLPGTDRGAGGFGSTGKA